MQQHQRQQAARFSALRQQSGQHPAQADRLSAQLLAGERLAAAGGAACDDVTLVKDQVNDRQQRFEPFLALDVGQLPNVLAAVDQQVEGVKDEVGALLLLQRRLQQLEAGLALFVDRDRLAVAGNPTYVGARASVIEFLYARRAA